MKLIYQIGRLDAQMKPLKFIYKNREYEKELSSFVLKEHFGNDAKVVLIYSVSLSFNRTLISDKSQLDDNFKSKIKNILENEEGRNRYLENPQEFFNNHPHSKLADDFIIIHSIGEYEGVKFEASYDDIVLEILFDMIERYFEDKFDELYVDISSGLNIYVSALLEAARHFSVFNQLQNWDDKSKCKIYKAFSDPILVSSASSYKIHQVETKFKAFFSSPIKKEDIDDYKLSRNITNVLFGEDNREFKRKLQKYFTNFAIHFSAIKNATPLANYTFEFDEINSIEEFSKEIIGRAKEKLSKNWKKGPQLPKDDFLKTLLSLGFYEGIIRIFKDKCIKPNRDSGVNLEEIEKFKGIYEIFGLNLNIAFIGNEIRNLEEGKDKESKKLADKVSENWELLNKFLYGEDGEFNPRNFFAHAGFERMVTEVKKCNEKLYFKYTQESLEKIKNSLLNNI